MENIRAFFDKFVHKIVKHDNTYNLYHHFNQTQYWEYDRLINSQYELFIKLWKHCVENIPYYQKIALDRNIYPAKISSLEDLNKLPFLTKDIVRANFNELKATNLPKARFGMNSTSGSSGSNFYFHTDRLFAPISKALTLRRYNWMNSSIFAKEFVIWGARWDIKRNSFLNSLRNTIKNRTLVSGYELSDDKILYIYEGLLNERPEILKSYPSILYKMAEVFERNDLCYSPKAITIGGEKLYDFQRLYIEKVFKTKIFDYYGSRDVPGIAQNCDRFEGLHVFMENLILEVIDENGFPIEDGEGELAVTLLHNYAMPLIRYKIGDRARITKNNKCSCGRGLHLIDEIIGRTFELIEFPNGNRVGGTFWSLLLRSVPGVKDFQVVQNQKNHIEIKYVPENFENDIDFGIISSRIREYGGADLKIDYELVEKLESNEAGKIQFVKSNIK